jgi:ankyrin repeat protein
MSEQLFEATQGGDLETVQRLVRAGTSVHDTDKKGQTPLQIAAIHGHDHIVAWFMTKEVNAMPPPKHPEPEPTGPEMSKAALDNATPLYVAAHQGHIDIVKCLVAELGAKVNMAKNNGCTPLYAAAKEGHYHVVKCLVDELGADINMCVSAVHVAMANGHFEIANFLIYRGAVVNMENLTGPALIWAQKREAQLDAEEDANQLRFPKTDGSDAEPIAATTDLEETKEAL